MLQYSLNRISGKSRRSGSLVDQHHFDPVAGKFQRLNHLVQQRLRQRKRHALGFNRHDNTITPPQHATVRLAQSHPQVQKDIVSQSTKMADDGVGVAWGYWSRNSGRLDLPAQDQHTGGMFIQLGLYRPPINTPDRQF